MDVSTILERGVAGAAIVASGAIAFASSPVITISSFTRQSSLSGFAVGCDTVDFPPFGFLSSSSFVAPGGALSQLAEVEGGDGCAAVGNGLEYLNTISPLDGAVMEFVLEYSSGCLPFTICGGDTAAQIDLLSGKASAAINGETFVSASFLVNEPAKIWVHSVYHVNAALSGSGSLASCNAQASTGQTLWVPDGVGGLMVHDGFSAIVSRAQRAGFDDEADTFDTSFVATTPGAYAVGCGGSASEAVGLNVPKAGDASASATASLTVTVHVAALSLTPGDLDGDSTVGPTDLAILLGAWGYRGPADLDDDGSVGASDLAILLGNWGP